MKNWQKEIEEKNNFCVQNFFGVVSVSFVDGEPLSFFPKTLDVSFRIDGRIIGGKPAKAGEFLGQVSDN